ncbi:phosphoribosyltransferase-like protein [Flavobacterium bizetiae]|uniref:phosphoribosyltransferase-like protein n=1 Tax=Flavobacterium bizetiae TaxID=2704140 RepID=UPI0037572D8A
MDIEVIAKIHTIFNVKKWHGNDGNTIVFTNFCNLLLNLTEVQRNLIFELAERYTWITLAEYQGRLLNIFNRINDSELVDVSKITIFPVIKPEHEDDTKSGNTVLYIIKGLKGLLPKFKTIEFEYLEQYEKLHQKDFKIKKNERVYLLDDYLGSGETVKASVAEVLKNTSIKPEMITVISLASQQESVEFLKEQGISLYTDFIERKGISDFYSSPELEEKVKVMQEIENLIPANHFRFGYNESEALITLSRTPDNTFPIFWKEYKKR